MKHQEFKEVSEKMIAQCWDTLFKKSKDYGSDKDVLNNFKSLGERMGLTPHQILSVYMQKHLDAINNFISKGKVESEPIEDRIMDVINYCLLLHALNVDTFKQPEKQPTEFKSMPMIDMHKPLIGHNQIIKKEL